MMNGHLSIRRCWTAGLGTLLALLCGGCGPGCDDPLLHETGTYRNVIVYQFTGVEPKKAFPHKRSKHLQMNIYSDLQQVTFQYVRDGKTVHETWTTTGQFIVKPRKSTTDAASEPGADTAAPDDGK